MKTRDLHAAGMGRSAIWRRVETGRLHRKYRGVYAVGQPKLSREGEFLAAVFACGDGAALGYLALAELYRVRRCPASLIDVVVPSKRLAESGIRVHVTRHLDWRDVTTYKGIPCTTFARLCVDLTDVLIAEDLAHVIHEAAYRGLFHPAAIKDAMQRANGRHNLHVLEEALALNAIGSAGLKSGNESAFLSMVKLNDLPTPKINVHLNGEEVDFHWPALKLAVEIDGPGHGRPRTRRDDARKAEAWVGAGYRVLHFTDEDLEQRPDEVIGSVRAAATG